MASVTTVGSAGRVCIVGGAGELADWTEQLLIEQPWLVWRAADLDELQASLSLAPDVVLLDARAGAAAVRVSLAALRAGPKGAGALALLLLSEPPPADLLELLADAGDDYLLWPARSDELLARVALLLRRSRGRREARQAQERHARELQALQRDRDEQRALAERVQEILERLPVGVILVSPANQIERVNAAMCRFTGYSAAELIGRQPGFMVLPEDHAATVTRGHQLAGGQIDHFVQERRRYVRKDGSYALGRLTAYALRDDDGLLAAFVAFVEDIGAQVQTEDELARYSRYQQALSNASLSLLAVAPDARAREQVLDQVLQQLVDGAYTSRAYLFRNLDDPRVGLAVKRQADAWSAGMSSLGDAPGAKAYPLLPYAALPEPHRRRLLAPLPAGGLVEEIYAGAPQLLDNIRAEGIRSTQTVPVIVDGAHWGFLGFDDYKEPRIWDHADLMLLTSAATMIGQTLHRWQVEDDLRSTSQFLRVTGQVARVGGWEIELESLKPRISDAAAEIFELDAAAPLDRELLLSFFPPEARPALEAAVRASSRDGRSWELELPMTTASGRRLWVNTHGHAELRDGRAARLFGTVQDVTRRKEAELLLERQLRVEAGLARCSQELLAPVTSDRDLRLVASVALEHLRSALDVDQAYLMRLVPDPAEPYLTMVAISDLPVDHPSYAHPLARHFPYALLSPDRRQALEAGRMVVGPPSPSEVVTPEQRAWQDQERAMSRITLPIRIDGTVWGVLGFNSHTPHTWSDEEQTVLGTAAEMLVHVIRRRAAEGELRRSEEQFRTAVETMLDGFAIFDSVHGEDGAILDFRYRYVNEVGCQLNQRTRDEQIGRTLLELLPAHRDSELFAAYTHLVATGEPVVRESLVYEDQYGGGERLVRVYDVRAARLGDGIAVVWRDVTDRRLAHESLAQANDDLLRRVNELRTLNMVAQTLAFTQDLASSLQTVCAAVAARTGADLALVACYEQRPDDHGAGGEGLRPREPIAGTVTLAPERLGALAGPLLTQRRAIALTRDAVALALGAAPPAELRLGEAAQLLLVPLAAPAANIGLLILGCRAEDREFSADDKSLAETMAGQIATAITNARLAEQARRAAALAERNRVARELHDSATQSLYSLSLLAGGWALKAEQGALDGVADKLNQLGEIALQVLKELRLLIYELRHPELVEAGLLKALEERLVAVEQRAGVRTSFDVRGDLSALPPDKEEQVYAILQEVLNNVLRHARARTVAITVRAEPGRAVFVVQDDGAGFEPTSPSGGLGLRGMRERAAAIGARLTLTSRQGAGTTVEVVVPVACEGDQPNG